MNATTKTLALALLAALLAVPVSADDGQAAAAAEDGPCEIFQYWIEPPGYQLRPECIGPFLDNLS